MLAHGGAGEGEVAGFLHAVVPAHVADVGVSVGVFGHELLKQVRDLLADQHEGVQGGRAPQQQRQDAGADASGEAAVQRVALGGIQLTDQPDEQPGVAGLLAHLVQGVGEAWVGDVGAEGELVCEPGHEHGLEQDPEPHDRRQFLAGQDGPLLGGELESEPGDGQELVGDHLVLGQAAGDLDVGLDDPPEGGGVEPLDPGRVFGVGVEAGGRGLGDGHGISSRDSCAATAAILESLSV